MTVLAIQIEVNGSLITTAGAEDISILSACLATVRPKDGSAPEAFLYVGGITDSANLNWVKEKAIQVGDNVTFRLVEVQQPDLPIQVLPTPSPAELKAGAAVKKRERRGLTTRSKTTRRKRRASKRGR